MISSSCDGRIMWYAWVGDLRSVARKLARSCKLEDKIIMDITETWNEDVE